MANDEASDLIEAALNEAFKLNFYDDLKEGDILNEWMLIGHLSNVNESDGHAYPILYSNGSMPTHVVRGLLYTALKLLDDPDD